MLCCDAGVVVGQFADESVVARRAGEVVRYICAAPLLAKKVGRIKALADLKVWPWISLVGPQFGDVNRVVLRSTKNQETTLDIGPSYLSKARQGYAKQSVAAQVSGASQNGSPVKTSPAVGSCDCCPTGTCPRCRCK